MIKISCVIPIRTGGNPKSVIDHLRSIDFPRDQIEIIVVEGDQPSRQRNQAVLKAKGEFVYFLDDDSFVTPSCINEGLRCFNNPDIVTVGGPAVTYDAGSFLERCFGDVTAAYWGGF